MFKTAIAEAVRWTCPLFTILRYVGDTEVVPGSATLIVVNSDGWLLTCKHVLNELLAAETVSKRRVAFDADKAAMSARVSPSALKKLRSKHGYDAEPVYELLHQLAFVDGFSDFLWHAHPEYDVALLKLNGFKQLRVSSFPAFSTAATPPPHGEFLCRVGYPFPEFSNFKYDSSTDSIGWDMGRAPLTPFFPLEGMVTRHLGAADGSVYGFEMSTPGLRGQSGGPVVSVDGTVQGMQFATAHLDLNFDVKLQVRRGPQKSKVTSTPFLHVGHAVAAPVLVAFMNTHGVAFKSA